MATCEWTVVGGNSLGAPLTSLEPSRQPLVLLFPTRRSTVATVKRWKHFYETSVASQSSAVVIFDKTPDLSATGFFSRLPAPVPQQSHIIQRPYEEDPFHAFASLQVAEDLFIMQMHDDDDWRGHPHLPIDVSGAAYAPAIVGTAAANPIGRLERFFGATRGDVWNAFMEFCGQFRQTSATMDQTFAFWLGSLPHAAFLEGYVYSYNNSNWDTWEKIQGANTRLTRELGWGDFAGPSAMLWTGFFDSLASLPYLSRVGSSPEIASTVRQLLRNPPPFAGSSKEELLRVLPERIRYGVVRSRGRGHGISRGLACMGVAVSRESLVPKSLRWIDSGVKSMSLPTILGDLLPSLALVGTPDMDARRTVWAREIIQLQEMLARENS